MSDDPFNIEDEDPAAAGGEGGVEKAVEVVLSDENIEDTVLSSVDDETAKQMLQIARKYHFEENDPAWLFAYVLIQCDSIINDTEKASRIAANEAQHAVMKRFEEDSSQITESLKKALVDAVRESKRNFDIAEKRMIESLEDVAQDFESRKVGIKKSTIVIVASLILIAGISGWWLGSNSIQRLQNDQIVKKAQIYDHILMRYDNLTEQQQQAIDKLLLN